MVAERKLQRPSFILKIVLAQTGRLDLGKPLSFSFELIFGPEHDQRGWQLHDPIVGWVATNVA